MCKGGAIVRGLLLGDDWADGEDYYDADAGRWRRVGDDGADDVAEGPSEEGPSEEELSVHALLVFFVISLPMALFFGALLSFAALLCLFVVSLPAALMVRWWASFAVRVAPCIAGIAIKAAPLIFRAVTAIRIATLVKFAVWYFGLYLFLSLFPGTTATTDSVTDDVSSNHADDGQSAADPSTTTTTTTTDELADKRSPRRVDDKDDHVRGAVHGEQNLARVFEWAKCRRNGCGCCSSPGTSPSLLRDAWHHRLVFNPTCGKEGEGPPTEDASKPPKIAVDFLDHLARAVQRDHGSIIAGATVKLKKLRRTKLNVGIPPTWIDYSETTVTCPSRSADLCLGPNEANTASPISASPS